MTRITSQFSFQWGEIYKFGVCDWFCMGNEKFQNDPIPCLVVRPRDTHHTHTIYIYIKPALNTHSSDMELSSSIPILFHEITPTHSHSPLSLLHQFNPLSFFFSPCQIHINNPSQIYKSTWSSWFEGSWSSNHNSGQI